MRNHPLGIYEKRWRKISRPERLVLAKAVALILSKCRWMKPTNGCHVLTGAPHNVLRWSLR
ncbi:hypothetical protein DMN57_11905 [Escherichia coli]|nr:hypothetical protein [Escherichia coli]